MNEISDFTGLGKAACELIEKISKACGWIYQNNLKVMAETAFIEEIKKSNLPINEKCVLICNASKLVKSFSNQNNIVKIAVEHLNSNSKPDRIDELWLNQFMEKSKLVSTYEVQLIWGKLLAEECNKPNSVPKSLLFVLEQMDSEDAEMFLDVCSCTVHFKSPDDEDFSPVIFDFSNHYYANTKISFESLFRLEELGLIKTNIGGNEEFQLMFNKGPVKAEYNNETYVFPAREKAIAIGNILFTKSGKALYNAANPSVINEYFKVVCIPFWRKYNSTAK